MRIVLIVLSGPLHIHILDCLIISEAMNDRSLSQLENDIGEYVWKRVAVEMRADDRSGFDAAGRVMEVD